MPSVTGWQLDRASVLGEAANSMTTAEIQSYIDQVLESNFENYTTQSGEMQTSEGGDGRFFGTVVATLYMGLPVADEIYLAIGETEKQTQIIKFGNSECLKPGESELDMILFKELGIESPDKTQLN